jgi:hypothetical protein
MLVMVSLAAVGLGWYGWHRRAFDIEESVLKKIAATRSAANQLSGMFPGAPVRMRDRVAEQFGGPTCIRQATEAAWWRQFDRVVGIEANYRELQDVSRLPSLKYLSCYGRAEGDITPLSDLVQLEALDLGDFWSTRASDELLKELAGLRRLRMLSLRGNKWIGPTSLTHLNRIRNLEVLDLSDTAVDDSAAAPLASLINLKHLRLNYTPVSNDGLQHIAGLKKLETLDLQYVSLSDEGMIHFRDLKSLKRVHLSLTLVSDQGLHHLHGLTNLEYLRLPPRATPAGVASLLRKLPNCRIEVDP